MRKLQPTSNFSFLSAHDPRLMQLGAFAERYFRDDPGTATIKLRQFAELLSKTVAAHHALYLDERQTFEETLRRLSYERIITKSRRRISCAA
jgi:type I restriction enzyme, R subunit